jgi:hypothetical protein
MMELDGRSVTADELARLALYNYGHFTTMRVERRAGAGPVAAARRPRRVPSSRRRSHNSRARKNTVPSQPSSTGVYVTMVSA